MTTSVDRGSLCLYHDNKFIEKSWNRSKSHSEILTHQIYLTLKQLSISVHDIETIIFDNGPGSFTGCRVTAGVAKALAYSLKVPLVTATSLACMAYPHKKRAGEILAVLDAHRSYFYFQKFMAQDGVLSALTQVQVSTLDQFEQVAHSSNLIVSFLEQKLPRKSIKAWPKAKTLIEMYISKSPIISGEDWTKGEPLYVRAPAAVENLGKS